MMISPRVKIQIRSTGETKEVPRMDARVMVALGRARYVGHDDGYGGKYLTKYADGAPQTYQTRHMEAAPAPKKRGRPSKGHIKA